MTDATRLEIQATLIRARDLTQKAIVAIGEEDDETAQGLIFDAKLQISDACGKVDDDERRQTTKLFERDRREAQSRLARARDLAQDALDALEKGDDETAENAACDARLQLCKAYDRFVRVNENGKWSQARKLLVRGRLETSRDLIRVAIEALDEGDEEPVEANVDWIIDLLSTT